MKRNPPFHIGLAGLVATTGIRAWMRTLDYKVAYYDRAVDPVYPECEGQKIYIFWHEYILFPLAMRGRCNLAMLLSRHRDAELLTRAALHFGFEFVRGSTSRGGTTAIRQMLRKSRDTHLTITPDGPRGPRRQLAPGCVFLASRLGLPLVVMGYAYDRPWRAKSWDRFAVPRPFSRARVISSPDIHVPPDLDRDGIEHYRHRVEDLLNHLTEKAEHWAESNRYLVGQQPILCRPAPRPLWKTKPDSQEFRP